MTRIGKIRNAKDLVAQWSIVEEIQDMYPYNRFGWFYTGSLGISYLVFYEEVITGLLIKEGAP